MRLHDLTRVEGAEVYKAGRRAGTLRRLQGGCVFAYDADYDGPAVATSLPRDVGEVFTPAGAVPPFFAGLLPEGRRLSALRRAVKTSADDELSMLLAVGGDAIGDVRVLPEGQAPPRLLAVNPVDLGTTTFGALFRLALAEDTLDRAALPGVQDKLSGTMIALPVAWGGHPSILKLEPPEFPHVVANEAFFLGLARRVGLTVPEFQVLHDAEGAAGLLVRRFDRVPDGAGGWKGRAQEDACQVLGLYPADKYRPTTEAVVGGLAAACGAPLVASRELMRQVTFAYLTCNGDLHAKNLSILQDARGEWRASPVYDLPSTHPYGDVTMALSVDGRRREDIGREHLIAAGAKVGLTEKATARFLDALVEGVEAGLDELDTLPFVPHTRHRLRKAIQWRLGRVRGGR